MSCPSLSCCPPEIFQAPPPGIQANLAGLLWLMPCVSNATFPLPGSCNVNNPADAVTTLQGDPSEVYDCTILIRGVFELAQYNGGTLIAGTNNMLQAGGANIFDGHNVYSLIISNPAQTYYLNRYDVIQGLNYNIANAIRYTGVIQIAAGATVTLRANGGDGGEATNSAALSITVQAGDPPLNALVLPQPYDGSNVHGAGQFMQMDCISIS